MELGSGSGVGVGFRLGLGLVSRPTVSLRRRLSALDAPSSSSGPSASTPTVPMASGIGPPGWIGGGGVAGGTGGLGGEIGGSPGDGGE